MRTGKAEHRVLGRHDEVARRCEGDAGSERGSRDRADDRDGALLYGEERLADVEHALPHVATVHRREVVEIVARTEVLAFAGEHDRSHTRTDLVDVDEEVVQLPVRQQIDGVHGRPAHGDGQDAVLVELGREGHSVLSLSVASCCCGRHLDPQPVAT
jgi:hypothetical protein